MKTQIKITNFYLIFAVVLTAALLDITEGAKRRKEADKKGARPTKKPVSRNGQPKQLPRNCKEIQKLYGKLDSTKTYEISTKGMRNIRVRCDFDTDGGGWTIIQLRDEDDPKYLFFRNWTAYENGFGSPESSYWIGLKRIHTLTHRIRTTLRIDLSDWDESTRYAVYRNFCVSKPTDFYRLTVTDYEGNAGDALRSGVTTHSHEMQFATYDQDHDKDGGNCALVYEGGWWFNSCFYGHLNGPHFNKYEPHYNYYGIQWRSWASGTYTSLKYARMMIRDDL